MNTAGAKNALMISAEKQTKYTPDILKLERQRYQVVFVTGREKNGFPMHEGYLKDALYFGDAFTASSSYVMVKQHLGKDTYPVSFRVTNALGRRLRGELYVIKTPNLIKLDQLYHNGVRYQRDQIIVDVKFTRKNETTCRETEEMVSTPAWIYLGLNSFFDTLVKTSSQFDLCEVLTPKNGDPKYYNFMKKDMPRGNENQK